MLSPFSLTPIKVRGKRSKKRPASQISSDNSAQSSESAASQSELSKHQKRRRIAAILSTTKRANPADDDPQKTPRLSHLECLPVELLEHIFLYCQNFNLPRASTPLGTALSRERLFKVLILEAFWEYPRCTQLPSRFLPGPGDVPSIVAQSFKPLVFRPLHRSQQVHRQMELFRCRWCTFERITQCLPDMFRLSIDTIWFANSRYVLDADLLPFDKKRVKSALAAPKHNWSFILLGEAEEDGVTVRLCVNPISVSTIRDKARIDKGHNTAPRPQRPKPRFDYNNQPFKVHFIPDKLISGQNFSTLNLVFLEHVLLTLFHRPDVTPDPFFSHEAVHEGIHTAIQTKNTRALRDLVWLATSTSDNNPNCPPFPSEHFITASREPSNILAMKILVRGAPSSVPYNSPELTSWAMELTNSHNAFGTWLLDYMTNLPRTQQIQQPMYEIDTVLALTFGVANFFQGKLTNQDWRVTRVYEDAFGQGPKEWGDEVREEEPWRSMFAATTTTTGNVVEDGGDEE
ncbi:hypothetical protein AJ80_06601 [Polytolypa hystricis UAMH7299]|uniref:Uncharacterized protein n=1 Tax=Polytolypa hystricis (strain UAMH7299) TaxID=1447883 RepID=A0A2B7XW98_POLH7|nr:hypothetical protein AJ80_06601 [Polytolypa hystricis UAMH7299]